MNSQRQLSLTTATAISLLINGWLTEPDSWTTTTTTTTTTTSTTTTTTTTITTTSTTTFAHSWHDSCGAAPRSRGNHQANCERSSSLLPLATDFVVASVVAAAKTTTTTTATRTTRTTRTTTRTIRRRTATTTTTATATATATATSTTIVMSASLLRWSSQNHKDHSITMQMTL